MSDVRSQHNVNNGTGGKVVVTSLLFVAPPQGTAHDRHQMEAGEAASDFVRRVFRQVYSDLSMTSVDHLYTAFHPSYTQSVDGAELDLAGFVRLVQMQKSRLSTAPDFRWQKLVATAALDGRIHVTSLHTVSANLLTGASMCQKVMALIELDVATGTIIRCDELTQRVENEATAHPAASGVAAASHRTRERPPQALPPSKHARPPPPLDTEQDSFGSSPMLPIETASELPQLSSTLRICGVPLKRSGISDLLADMCGEFLPPQSMAADDEAIRSTLGRPHMSSPTPSTASSSRTFSYDHDENLFFAASEGGA